MADLAFAGVARHAELLRSGELSSRDLTQRFLDRIAEHDPVLNSYRLVFAESALAEADAADRRLKAGERAPLLGVPIAIKDDQHVAGHVTAYGSIAHGGPETEDAEIVRRLREAGAVVLGKTNVPELMTMAFTETLWYGATRNPWDLDRTPGGSSGGSAAAVAAGLCSAATASDGAGSIRIPAACTGLVGLKPGAGVVPTPPHWNGLSTYGFVTRYTADSVLLYEAVCGGRSFAADAPSGLRISWSAKPPLGALKGPDATMRGALDSMITSLRGLGHDVYERDPELGLIGNNVVGRYLSGINDSARELPHRDRLDRRSRGLARLGALQPKRLVDRAVAAGSGSDRDRILRALADADLLLFPVINELPARIGDYEGMGAVRSLNKAFAFTPFPGLFNHTGLPAVAVPTERTEAGFPLSAMLAGPEGSEGLLLAVAAQLEGAIGFGDRVPPRFS